MQFITVENLSKMLFKGSIRIIENKEKINAINVFPVADSDTGSNLANTFSGIKEILEKNVFSDANSLVDKVLDSAFKSSRGNSGIIMTNYLKGFLCPLKEKNSFYLEDFISASKSGEEHAKKSVQNPIKGTVLDVMEAFSRSLDSKQSDSLLKIFYHSTQHVKKSLKDTKNKMEILEQNNIVDAGALGFTFFIFGLYEGLSSKIIDLSEIEFKKIDGRNIEMSKFNHEVIFIINKPLFSSGNIREMLNKIGDNLDIIEMSDKIKVHIHTDKPAAVKQTAFLMGEIEEIKEMEMIRSK